MATSATVWRMPARRQEIEGPLTPRQAAGQAAKEIIDYRGFTQASVARQDHKMSVKTLSRIVGGDPTVGAGMLRSLAGILKLPPSTFLLIGENDIARIRGLVMLRPEEDEPIRDLILGIMGRIEKTPKRRSTDS